MLVRMYPFEFWDEAVSDVMINRLRMSEIFGSKHRRLFSKHYIPIFAVLVYFAQSWLSLDVNTLITYSLGILIVQGTELCQTKANKSNHKK